MKHARSSKKLLPKRTPRGHHPAPTATGKVQLSDLKQPRTVPSAPVLAGPVLARPAFIAKEVRTPLERAWESGDYEQEFQQEMLYLASRNAEIAFMRWEVGGCVEDALMQCMFYLWAAGDES